MKVYALFVGYNLRANKFDKILRGIYSSREKAEEQMELLKKLVKHKKLFYIMEYTLDELVAPPKAYQEDI